MYNIIERKLYKTESEKLNYGKKKLKIVDYIEDIWYNISVRNEKLTLGGNKLWKQLE